MRALYIAAAVAAGATVLLLPKKAFAYVQGKPTEITLKPIGLGLYMRSDAATAFLQMQSAAADDGITLAPNSGFRTMDEQRALRAKWEADPTNNAYAAEPGFSNHQGGVAVDVQTGGFGSAIHQWMAANAANFGFWQPTSENSSTPEAWHWEFRT